MYECDKDRCAVSTRHNCTPAFDSSQYFFKVHSGGVAPSALHEANAASSVAAESTRHLNIRVQGFLLGKSHMLPALTGGGV